MPAIVKFTTMLFTTVAFILREIVTHQTDIFETVKYIGVLWCVVTDAVVTVKARGGEDFQPILFLSH